MTELPRRRLLRSIGGTAALTVGGVGVVTADDDDEGSPDDGPTIVDIAAGVDRFSILVAAVQRAGLVDALSGNRQLTVFAPNNDAFLELLDALGLDGLDDVPVETLRSILLYHVAPGRRDAESVLDSDELPTLNGTKIEVEGTTLNPDGDFPATIISPNLAFASNGVIHEIDGVINPADQADTDDDEDEEDEEDEDEDEEEDDD